MRLRSTGIRAGTSSTSGRRSLGGPSLARSATGRQLAIGVLAGGLGAVGAELFRPFRYVDRTRILIDNSNGADAQFASELQAALAAAGFDVELREPSPRAFYDTSVHFVVEGVAIRLLDDPGRLDLAAIAKTVREIEAHRRSEHRRFRDVPIYRGESSRVLTWVDVFD